MSSEIRQVLQRTAADFGEPARSTILYQNWYKHTTELELIRESLPPDGALVDVGGGLGVNVLCLRALGHRGRLVLIDRFAEYDEHNQMGSQRRGRELLAGAGIEVLEADFWPALQIPLDSANCDVATSFDVIEHLPGNPLQHLTEIHRILRPGARLIVGAPNAAALMKRVNLALRGRNPYSDFEEWMTTPYFEHYREYTPAEYREIVRRAGFEFTGQALSSAIPKSKARYRYHRGRHPWWSPVTAALLGIAVIEAACPGLRHTVYTVATKPAASARGANPLAAAGGPGAVSRP